MKTFEPLEQLMQKRMSRRDFLKHMLAIIVAMIGVTGFIQLLANPSKKAAQITETKTAEKVTQGGYGNTPYGV